MNPVAWSYELATEIFGNGAYTGWRKHLTNYKPKVPEGSIRNVRPLYERPEPPTPNPDHIENDADTLRYVASILEAHADKLPAPSHIRDHAARLRRIAQYVSKKDPDPGVLQDDLQQLLEFAGLPTHARSQSPQEVFQEALTALRSKEPWAANVRLNARVERLETHLKNADAELERARERARELGRDITRLVNKNAEASAELKEAIERQQELASERDEANRQAGAAERKLAEIAHSVLLHLGRGPK